MELNLDTLQADTLREVLESALADLRFEIADTDNSQFKAGLRQREQVIASLLGQLRTEPPSPQG